MEHSLLIEPCGSGDAFLLKDVLPPSMEEGAFEELSNEVCWEKMLHRGDAIDAAFSTHSDADTL